MKKIIYTCDICHKDIDEHDIYHIKTKSSRNINYNNCGEIGNKIKKIDICANCFNKFQEFVNENIR